MKIIVFVILLVIFSYIYIKKKKAQKFNKSYTCPDGQFHLNGTQEDFQITKDNRYIFSIRNGEIVSVTDTQKSENPLRYEEDRHGTI